MENEKLIVNADFGNPEYKSELVINNDYVIKFVNPVPNAWIRFWTKIMFGWQWRSLTKRVADGGDAAPLQELSASDYDALAEANSTPPANH